IAMCGADGNVGPACCTIRPSVNDAPDSSRPDTNCDDAEASMSTAPPATDPAPCTRNGNPSPAMSTPRPRSASSNGAIGRTRACSSPSKLTAATPNPASGGTKRSTVPARPQSIRASAAGEIVPLIVSSAADPSTRRPNAPSAPIIRSVSRLRSAPLIVETPPFAAASAASTNARLVSDFEPGTVTVAHTGRCVCGAAQVFTCSIIAYPAPWRYVRTIRGDDRPGGAGREDPGDQRGARGRVDGTGLQRGADHDHHHRGPPARRTRRRTHQASPVHAVGIDTAVGQGRLRRCAGVQGSAADQRQGREGHHLAGVSRECQIQTLPDPDGRLLRMACQ